MTKTGILLSNKFDMLNRILGGKAQSKIQLVVPKVYDADMVANYPNFVWELLQVKVHLNQILTDGLNAEQVAAVDGQRRLQAFYTMWKWEE